MAPGRCGLLLALAIATVAAPASGQRLTAELRAGAAVGNYTGTDAGLDIVPAPSFGAAVELRLSEWSAGYAGINRSSFGCEEALCEDRDLSLTNQGLTVGTRFSQGPAWARVGLAIQVLTVASEATRETSDPGIGWDLAAGVDVPVGRGFRIRPGVTYLRHDAATEPGAGRVALLALEVGVAMTF